MKRLLFLLFSVTSAAAAQSINPATQIAWPRVTGSGAPALTCGSIEYGMPYTDLSQNPAVGYVCTIHGWQVTGGGGGTVGPGTPGFLLQFLTSTTAGNSHIDDGHTTASTITATEPVVIATGGGIAGSATIGHGTAPAGVAGSAILTSDSTNGYLETNENNTSLSRVCTAANGQCPTGLSGMTATQVPIAATATTVTSSKALAGSGSGITTGPTSATNGHCVQFTGTSGQIADSGGACGGGGGTPAPPYLQIGSTLYLPQDGMYAVTKPPSSPVWINSVAPGTIINGTNGDILYAQSGTSTFYWEIESGTASVESVFQCLPTASTGSTGACGVYLYDVTNSLLYTEIEVGAGSSAPSVQIDSYSYTGSGNPSSGVNIATLASAFNGWASFAHMKIVKSGSSLLFQISPNGGGNFLTIYTQTGVGTISAGGVGLFTGTPMAMEVASEVVQ